MKAQPLNGEPEEERYLFAHGSNAFLNFCMSGSELQLQSNMEEKLLHRAMNKLPTLKVRERCGLR
jgi:hypothetical protein